MRRGSGIGGDQRVSYVPSALLYDELNKLIFGHGEMFLGSSGDQDLTRSLQELDEHFGRGSWVIEELYTRSGGSASPRGNFNHIRSG